MLDVLLPASACVRPSCGTQQPTRDPLHASEACRDTPLQSVAPTLRTTVTVNTIHDIVPGLHFKAQAVSLRAVEGLLPRLQMWRGPVCAPLQRLPGV